MKIGLHLVGDKHDSSFHQLQLIFLDDMRSLFKVNFSEKGNTYRPVEEAAYIFFINFMEECAGIKTITTTNKKYTFSF